MFSTADTIVAIATPPGRGALGVVRLSGPDASRIARELIGRATPLVSRRATFARLSVPSPSAQSATPRAMTDLGDEVVVTAFPAPRSSTGEDCVEISAHGSPVVLAGILRAAVGAGARLAEPGEFSLRAFLNGKRDLVQVEAVADLVDAVTPLQARAAFDQLQGTLTQAIVAIEAQLFDVMARLEASLDFPDEGYHFIAEDALGAALADLLAKVDALLSDASRGRLVREGALVTLVGAPNVGKSSLFNALVQANRAIVTPVPGTTRDLLTERVDLSGLSVSLVDTAGLRPTDDLVEQEGVRRAEGSLTVSDLVLAVLDRSRPLTDDDRRMLESTARRRRVVVVNKIDLDPAWDVTSVETASTPVEISVRSGHGLDALIERVGAELSGTPDWREQTRITNVRHVHLLEQARASFDHARRAVLESNGQLPEEFVLADLQDAHAHLQEITGRRTSEDLLRHIFARFCIGK